jgi:hypothetical protein
LFMIKDYVRNRPCPIDDRNFKLSFNIPVYPTINNNKVNFVVKFNTGPNITGYTLLSLPCPTPDTSSFRFWVKDNAGNISDTVTTERLPISF